MSWCPAVTVGRMLVLRVEVWPGGDHGRAYEIARVGIANVSGLAPVSDYRVVCHDERGERCGTVPAHARAAGWLPLAVRALTACQTDGTGTVARDGRTE